MESICRRRRVRRLDLFGRSVDLVEALAIENPFFREAVERNRRTLYAA